MTWEVYGKAVARVGDMTVCPKCKGVFAITTGAERPDGFRPGRRTAWRQDCVWCHADRRSVVRLVGQPFRL
nr:PAAR domain-containing protein [Massilia sp. PDC64]